MLNGIDQALDEHGVDPNVRELVLAAAAEIPIQVASTIPGYVALVGAAETQVALYVHKRLVSVALPAERSGHFAATTGGSIQKKNARTHYLLLRQQQLNRPDNLASMVEACVFSVAHCREIPGGRDRGTPEPESLAPTCPTCFLVITPADTCGCD